MAFLQQSSCSLLLSDTRNSQIFRGRPSMNARFGGYQASKKSVSAGWLQQSSIRESSFGPKTGPLRRTRLLSRALNRLSETPLPDKCFQVALRHDDNLRTVSEAAHDSESSDRSVTATASSSVPSCSTSSPPTTSSPSLRLLSLLPASLAALPFTSFSLEGPGSVLQAILALAAIVTVHEAGHFLAARSLGIRVTKFSVGFGPVLWSATGSFFRASVFPRLRPNAGHHSGKSSRNSTNPVGMTGSER